jgi:hypothetical protein
MNMIEGYHDHKLITCCETMEIKLGVMPFEFYTFILSYSIINIYIYIYIIYIYIKMRFEIYDARSMMIVIYHKIFFIGKI